MIKIDQSDGRIRLGGGGDHSTSGLVNKVGQKEWVSRKEYCSKSATSKYSGRVGGSENKLSTVEGVGE